MTGEDIARAYWEHSRRRDPMLPRWEGLAPFCGTGTVPAVAHALGRHGIGIDLSADYLRLAEWRCNDPALRAKVLRVDKPKAVPDGQLDIFGGEAA